MQKYPTFIDVTLWKKCEPEEASSGNPSRLVSTMIFAALIWGQVTGISDPAVAGAPSPGADQDVLLPFFQK